MADNITNDGSFPTMSKFKEPQFLSFNSEHFVVNGHEFSCAPGYRGFNYRADKTQDVLEFFDRKSNPFARTASRCYYDEKTGLWQSLPGTIENGKLGMMILGTGMMPRVTCPNCKDCQGDCYGGKGRFLYTNPHNKLVTNTIENLVNPEFYFDLLELQIKSLPFLKAVRTDVTGDYVSERHIQDWENLAKKFPKLRFYGYTKTDYGYKSKVANFNNVLSYLPDGELNFGTLDVVLALDEKYKSNKEVYLCPKGIPDKNGVPQEKRCEDCLWCAYHKYVILLIH